MSLHRFLKFASGQILCCFGIHKEITDSGRAADRDGTDTCAPAKGRCGKSLMVWLAWAIKKAVVSLRILRQDLADLPSTRAGIWLPVITMAIEYRGFA